MSIENATYLHQLNPALPANTDPIPEGDDHLRLLKGALQNTFPNVTGPVTATQTALNNPILSTTPTTDTVPFYSGSGAAALSSFPAFGRSLAASASAADALSTLTLSGVARKETPNTFSQDQDITKVYPSLTLTYPNVRSTRLQVRENGIFYLWDVLNNEPIFSVSPAGVLWSKTTGEVKVALDNLTAIVATKLSHSGYASPTPEGTALSVAGRDGLGRLKATDSHGEGPGYVMVNPDGRLGRMLLNASGPQPIIDMTLDGVPFGWTVALSDASFKKNVQDSTTDALGIVRDLRFRSFDWKPGFPVQGHVELGVVAQEVEQVAPALVETLSGGTKQPNHNALTMVALKAVQELASAVDELRATLADLKARCP